MMVGLVRRGEESNDRHHIPPKAEKRISISVRRFYLSAKYTNDPIEQSKRTKAIPKECRPPPYQRARPPAAIHTNHNEKRE
jgi:hypothetical protein